MITLAAQLHSDLATTGKIPPHLDGEQKAKKWAQDSGEIDKGGSHFHKPKRFG